MTRSTLGALAKRAPLLAFVAAGAAWAAAAAPRRAPAQEPPPSAAPAAAPRPDVLLITLDTTRRDFLGCYGRTPSPTPTLDALARDAVVFEDALTPVPLTLPAHATLFTGLQPYSHGIHDNSLYRLPDGARTLAESLREAGYATGAAVASFVLDPVFGLAQGFDRYHSPPRGVSSNRSMHFTELPATTQVERALGDLAELARAGERPPFFYWLHLFDVHAPYAPKTPPQFGAGAGLDRNGVIRVLYEAELAEMDRELARLFAAWKRGGLDERSIVIVCADHGESLGDGPEETHGHFVHDSTLRIPLIWRERGLPAGRVAAPVTLADVAPTLLARCGVDARGESHDGIDLSPWLVDPSLSAPDRVLPFESWYVWLNYGFAPFEGATNGTFKYVRSAREALHDRVADPLERTNLFTPDDPRAQGLRRRLAAAQQAAQPLARDNPALSEADRAALAALGYAQGGSTADLPEVDWSTLPDAHDKLDAIAGFDALSAALERADWEGALTLLRELVKREPASALFHEQLGMMLINLGPQNADESIAELQRTLELDPRRARVWFALARAFEAKAADARHRKDEARQRGKGREAKRAGDEERAFTAKSQHAARECLRLEGNYPDALMFLGRMVMLDAEKAYAAGDKEGSRPLYQEVVALVERFFASVGPESPDTAPAVAVREHAKKRLAELDAPRR
ncbi:MAG: sulfatase-like hydrolase/transferase [Planctomycetes bacterium]|nr:sulfatase-like hydrolase/transferase [Planctomycetota bacterium]